MDLDALDRDDDEGREDGRDLEVEGRDEDEGRDDDQEGDEDEERDEGRAEEGREVVDRDGGEDRYDDGARDDEDDGLADEDREGVDRDGGEERYDDGARDDEDEGLAEDGRGVSDRGASQNGVADEDVELSRRGVRETAPDRPDEEGARPAELGAVACDREDPMPGALRVEPSDRPLSWRGLAPGRGRLEPMPGARVPEPERPVPAAGGSPDRERLEPMPGMRRSSVPLALPGLRSPVRGRARRAPDGEDAPGEGAEDVVRPRLTLPRAVPGVAGSARSAAPAGRGRRIALGARDVASARASPLRVGRDDPFSARRTEAKERESTSIRRREMSRRPRSPLRATDQPAACPLLPRGMA